MAESGQLALPVEGPPPVRAPRFRPMEPSAGEAPFNDPDYLFEPWWPGVRLFVTVSGSGILVSCRQLIDPLPEFPELRAIPGLVEPDEVLIDGVLMVLDDAGRPDAGLLRRRLGGSGRRDAGSNELPAPARAGSTRPAGTPAFVAIDLLRVGRRSLGTRSFVERRARLVDAVRPADWFAVSRGVIGEGTVFADAAARLGFAAISARLLLAHHRGGPAGEAWLRLPVAGTGRGGMSPLVAVFRALPL